MADQEPADQSQTAVTLKGKRFPRKDKVVGRLKVLFPLIKAEHKKRNSCLFKNLPRSSSGTRVSKIPGSRQMLRNGRCRSAFLDLPFQPLFDSSIVLFPSSGSEGNSVDYQMTPLSSSKVLFEKPVSEAFKPFDSK